MKFTISHLLIFQFIRIQMRGKNVDENKVEHLSNTGETNYSLNCCVALQTIAVAEPSLMLLVPAVQQAIEWPKGVIS